MYCKTFEKEITEHLTAGEKDPLIFQCTIIKFIATSQQKQWGPRKW